MDTRVNWREKSSPGRSSFELKGNMRPYRHGEGFVYLDEAGVRLREGTSALDRTIEGKVYESNVD